MSRIFLSHSSSNNAEAVALRDWLAANGWKDEVFLDLDPLRGIAAGERWERALSKAVNRCEAVLFLVSKAWLTSGWCLKEFDLAYKLNKPLFGVLIEDLPVDDLPANLTSTWQIVRLAAGRDHVMLRATVPITHDEAHVTFSVEGLQRLKHGLEEAGLSAKYFIWPPPNDPDRPPYRGLRPLEADDAGIFFGRDGPIVEALDRLRGLRATTSPRLLVILGASGAGKSSFLRAGLFPRLQRDDCNFLPLPIIRPLRAAVSGDAGLIAALEGAVAKAGMQVPRADLRAMLHAEPAELRKLLQTLANKATIMAADEAAKGKPPTLILSIDQGEELFLAEAEDEARAFLALLGALLKDDAPAVIAVFTIRSDHYERLQLAPELQGLRQDMLSLPPMPRGAYAEVVKGPARRLDDTPRALEIEDALVNALLTDIDAGGAKDALPLLAFTLERLYEEYHAGGSLKLAHYDKLGRVRGSIEAAVERAFKIAEADPILPRDRVALLALLRRGFIPWLAGIDPDTGAPRRRVARLSEIPAEAQPLIQHLVEQRLLITDVAREPNQAAVEALPKSEVTVEVAHEAILRQWSQLQTWLFEDAGLLAVLEGVRRASSDWEANKRDRAWLTHTADRLVAAQRLSARPDLAASLRPRDRAYLAACTKAEADARRRWRVLQGAVLSLLLGIIAGLTGWIYQSYIADQWRWWTVTRPYAIAQIWPYVMSAAKEQALNPGDSFKECAQDCPEMVVIEAGSFTMGGSGKIEQPQHTVTFAKPFAVSKYELTFADWDTCVTGGGCNRYRPKDSWGRGRQPVINVSWEDAQRYVAWFSQVTGKAYRLLSEAEYEYATRAGSTTNYPWGPEIQLDGQVMANCFNCGSNVGVSGKWDGKGTAPVGLFPANKFGLYDMLGNVWQWTEDCWHPGYEGAPTDGSAWLEGADCGGRDHVIRGGSWFNAYNSAGGLRSATRNQFATTARNYGVGIRVARTLSVRASDGSR